MDETVLTKFSDYPDDVTSKLLNLRSLILSVASELELGCVEETFKWGELTFNVKFGSPIRIDWKLKSPSNYYIFFNCQTKLIDTFRELYSDILEFEGNRAIVLNLSEPIPEQAVKHCIKLGLTYQKVKDLPLLGA